MALTFTVPAENIRPYHIVGDLKLVMRKVTFDNSYPTGGEAVAASDFGLAKILWISVNAQTDVLTKHVRWVESAGAHTLLIAIEDSISGIEAQAGNATDQSAVSVHLMVFGY
jgi:hypothetical protein